MTNQELEPFELSLAQAEKALPEFKSLLDRQDELSESKDVLPFFAAHPHLAVLCGSAKLQIETIDRARREFSLFSHFRCDWAIGDSSRREFSLIEFEDARRTSVFGGGKKYHDEWGKRLEHGFSQIIDWAWSLDAYRNTPDFVRNFGQGDAEFFAMLVVGRTKFANNTEDQVLRMKWRHRHLSIRSIQIFCITFNELYEFLSRRVRFVRAIADHGDLK